MVENKDSREAPMGIISEDYENYPDNEVDIDGLLNDENLLAHSTQSFSILEKQIAQEEERRSLTKQRR